MNRRETIFIYPKTKNGERTGHTIAVVIREGMMFYGEALCSKEDQFSRKEGRELALVRAEERYKKYLERTAKA